MGEIKTSQFSLSANDLVISQRIYNKKGSRKDFIIFMFTGFLVIFLAISPLILMGLFLPLERTGIIPSLFAALKNQQFIILSVGVIVILEYIIFPQFIKWRIKRSYQANKNQFQNVEIHFTDQGINYIGSNSNSKFDWSYFNSVIENKDYFLIVFGNHLSVIPKLVLAESQIPALTEMLKSHISRYEIRN